jgi:Ricin-type beta-trefoil lectin domain/Putative Ig domain
MKMRTLLAAGAIATAAAATAFAVPGIAGAANGAAPAITTPQFQPASGTVTTGKVSGIIPARGTSLKKNAAIAKPAATAASCPSADEPSCPLVYNGGPVEHTSRVYLVFWGPEWTSDTATQNFVISFFTSLGQTSDDWSTTVEQYGDATGHPTFGTSLLAGTWVDTSSAPGPSQADAVTLTGLGDEATKAVTHFGITDTDDANIVIASQSGTCFAPLDPAEDPTFTFAGNCGTEQDTGYCAFHSDVPGQSGLYLPFENLPYQPDAGAGCGQGFINTPGTDDGYSISGGHELMEAITDPEGNAWTDSSDSVSGGEVADKCAWGGELWGGSDPYGNVTLATGTFAMQSLWSNATGGCVMTGSLPLSVTTPATQSSTLGKGVSLQITASIGGAKTPLTYTSSGLPAGLSLNKTSGLISGTPGVTAGTHSTKVTVSYYDGSQTVGFTWKVSAPTGQLKLTGTTTKCLDDSGGKTTLGNKIDILTCAAGAAQQIHFASDNELQVAGGCVTGTSVAALEPCTAAPSQRWTRQSNGEYVLKPSGLCLTDPSRANGTQLTLAACTGAATQEWTLP